MQAVNAAGNALSRARSRASRPRSARPARASSATDATPIRSSTSTWSTSALLAASDSGSGPADGRRRQPPSKPRSRTRSSGPACRGSHRVCRSTSRRTRATYRKSYDNLPVVAGWSRSSSTAYYATGASRGGASRAFVGDEEEATETTADYEFTEQGVFLTTPFQVNDAETITDVRIRYGLMDDDGAPVLIGEDPGAFTAGRRGCRGWGVGPERAQGERRPRQLPRCTARSPSTPRRTRSRSPRRSPTTRTASTSRTVLTVFGNVVVDLIVGQGAAHVLRDEAGPDARSSATPTMPGSSSPRRASSSIPTACSCRSSRGSAADGELQFVKVSDTSIAGGAQLRADPDRAHVPGRPDRQRHRRSTPTSPSHSSADSSRPRR